MFTKNQLSSLILSSGTIFISTISSPLLAEDNVNPIYAKVGAGMIWTSEIDVEDSSNPVVSCPTHGPTNSVQDLPKLKDVIMYKTSDADDWITGSVVSRGGKVGGRHSHFLNVKQTDCDDTAFISFRYYVVEWKKASDLDEVYSIDERPESAHFVYHGKHVSSDQFHNAKLDEIE